MTSQRRVVQYNGLNYFRHINPDGSLGGLVDPSSDVAPTVYVAFEARVAGFCELRDRVQILGAAYVCGASYLYDDVVVNGGSVYAGSRLYGNVVVEGMADGVSLWGYTIIPAGCRLTKDGTIPLPPLSTDG
jgi:hypothetical protein